MKIGIFVDGENIKYNGGFHIKYNILKNFALKENGDIQRMNTYIATDIEKMKTDIKYKNSVRSFQDALRDIGWRVHEKNVKWFRKSDGNIYSKANADIDIVVDVMNSLLKLDKVILVTGDGDFAALINHAQRVGCQVEVIGFENVSNDIQKCSDIFYSGFLIPELCINSSESRLLNWGDIGSKVNGVCSQWHKDKNFGFMRYIYDINKDLSIMDSRDENSAFKTCFFHLSDLPENFDVNDLPNRDIIFSFTLGVNESNEKNIIAKNIEVVYRYDR